MTDLMLRIKECALMTLSSQVRVKSPVSSLLWYNLPRCEAMWVVAKLILLPKNIIKIHLSTYDETH